MLKTDLLPLFFRMTCIASFSILAIMYVIFLMTGITHRLGSVVEDIVLMTILAQQAFVGIDQLEVGIFIMVEFNFAPALIRMALTTFDTARTFVHIVKRMTKIAVLWRTLIAFINVTTLARHITMVMT
jgi:hypothetical protein